MLFSKALVSRYSPCYRVKLHMGTPYSNHILCGRMQFILTNDGDAEHKRIFG